MTKIPNILMRPEKLVVTPFYGLLRLFTLRQGAGCERYTPRGRDNIPTDIATGGVFGRLYSPYFALTRHFPSGGLSRPVGMIKGTNRSKSGLVRFGPV